MSGELTKLNTLFRITFFLILTGFLPSLVYENYFAKAYVSFVILFGFLFVLYFNYKKIIFSKDEETFIGFGVLIYLVALSGFFQQTPELTRFGPAMEGYLKALVPLGLIPILHFLKVRNLNFYFVTLALACLTAFGSSFLGVAEGFRRGGGDVHGSAIIFGDLAMLFGLLSCVIALYFFKLRKHLLLYVFLFIGALGIISSLLSGSRGGWLAIFTVPFLFLLFLEEKRHRHLFLGLFLVVIIVLVSIGMSVDNISSRVHAFWRELEQLLFLFKLSGGSLGARIQMWEVALQAFLSSPVFGIGVGEFFAYKANLILNGEASVKIERFKHAHNEYLTILSSMGLVGIAAFFFMFRWLWRYFSKAIKSSVLEKKILGLSGLVVIVCMIDFSLSESFLSSHLGGAAFYFLIALFIYLISQQHETA
ncbi:MAG: O-antigen ligase family protein [Pseudomonadota bacterium]|nr:O-antigen ligase family protein [Pseudomonadota bacterium]